MRYLIMLEQTGDGFAVQVPDLAISTAGKTIESAKLAACQAIGINLEAYRQLNQEIPPAQDIAHHLENPDFRDLLFAYVEVAIPHDLLAA